MPTAVPADWFSETVVEVSATSVGPSLMFVTVIVNAFSVQSPPWSLERTRTKYLLLASKLKDEPARNWPPLIVNDALSVEPVPATSVYVNVFPESGSVVVSVPTAAPMELFSAIDDADSAISVGPSLTFVTDIVTTFSNQRPP